MAVKFYEDTICEIAEKKGWPYGAAERWFENILRFVGKSQGWTLGQMTDHIDEMTEDEYRDFIENLMACV